MKRIKLNDRRTIATAVFVVTVLVSFLAVSLVAPRDKAAGTPSDSKPNQKLESMDKPAETKKPKQNQPGQQPLPTPQTSACKLFTQLLAVQVLGNNASVSPSESITISETVDMEMSSCTYTSGGSTTTQKTVSLQAHRAKTALGESANAVQFGSGRPAGVQTVPGFGQAAFWDNMTGTLHVLKSNNHFTINLTRGIPAQIGDQHDTEVAASVIVPKL
jgi:hypothetical protein